MRPTPDTIERVENIITGALDGDYNTAHFITRVLRSENLLAPSPADEHPGWKGVMSGIAVETDEINHESATAHIVRVDFRNSKESAHFGLLPIVAERLSKVLQEAVDEVTAS